MLVRAGLNVLPAGVFEQAGALQCSFGKVFQPDIPRQKIEIDYIVAEQVMAQIRQQICR
jgi:hypothetical protein